MGYAATAIGERALSQATTICGTSRCAKGVAALKAKGFDAVIFDGVTASAELLQHLEAATHLLISIAPGENDRVLAALPQLPEIAKNLEWAGYLSTVGVYGNHDGAWVDEKTEPRPVQKRSITRLAAETAWQNVAAGAGWPLAIFRLSGIYGPGRNAFVAIEAGKSRRLVKKAQVFNRIHRDDIASAVVLAMDQHADGIFNITDDEPAPPQDVVAFAHKLMGREPPPKIDFETADLTPMARSFYGENKRVANSVSKTRLGMIYQWPDYRAALTRMWQDAGWR